MSSAALALLRYLLLLLQHLLNCISLQHTQRNNTWFRIRAMRLLVQSHAGWLAGWQAGRQAVQPVDAPEDEY